MTDLATLRSPDVPQWLRGAWRRELLETADGGKDLTTAVIWLQTRCLFADIRIPHDRPAFAGRRGVEDCSPDELVAATRARGFAGWTTFSDGLCRWHRPIDFHPPAEHEDAGRLDLKDGALWEYGVHEAYKERYARVGDGLNRTAAWVRTPDASSSRPGVLIVVDDFIIRALGRDQPLPAGANLGDLVREHAHDLPTLRKLFACELCLASTETLRITHSTLPWREGDRLTSRGSFRAGSTVDDLFEAGPLNETHWRRRGGGPSAAEMCQLLND